MAIANSLIDMTLSASARVTGSMVGNNAAYGGNGGAPGPGALVGGTGGRSQGGGISAGRIFEAPVVMNITNSQIMDNLAQGGDGGGGAEAGNGEGGGLWNGLSEMALRNTEVARNRAIVGSAAVTARSIGGGVYNTGTLRLKTQDVDRIFENQADDCENLFDNGVCI
jgi:hypothetical protein